MAMKLYFPLEIGDESLNRTWILMSSVILIQLQKLLYMFYPLELIAYFVHHQKGNFNGDSSSEQCN